MRGERAFLGGEELCTELLLRESIVLVILVFNSSFPFLANPDLSSSPGEKTGSGEISSYLKQDDGGAGTSLGGGGGGSLLAGGNGGLDVGGGGGGGSFFFRKLCGGETGSNVDCPDDTL